MRQNESDSSLVEEVVPGPIDQDEETISKADQIVEVYAEPDCPGWKSGEVSAQ
jgi:hypothetical protein